MSYGMRIHGAWCGAQTIPIICRYCGEPVFFFQCRCGCKVFFEELGAPWPKHLCDEYLQSQQLLRPADPPLPTFVVEERVDDKPVDEEPVEPPDIKLPISEIMVARAIMNPKEHDYPIKVEPAYVVKMRRNLEAERTGRRERLRMEPPPRREHQDTGRVTDLAEKVNVYRQAHLPEDNPLAAGLLGPLAKEPMARVVLVVDDPEQDDLEEYACYIPQKLLKRSGVIRGDVVHFTIRPVEIPARERVWLCIEMESMFKW